MQHPYINFGPLQHHDEDGTLPPALPPKRSSRSHPGSFRSEGNLALLDGDDGDDDIDDGAGHFWRGFTISTIETKCRQFVVWLVRAEQFR